MAGKNVQAWDGAVDKPRLGTLLPGSVEDLQKDGLVVNRSFSRLRLTGAENLTLRGSSLDKSALADSQFTNTQILDSVFEDCDLTNSVWLTSSFQRVHFCGCRMTGFQCGDGYLDNVLFEKCRLDLSAFRFSEAKGCIFKGCELKGADLQQAKFTNVSFESCNFEAVSFREACLKNVDLRTSDISGAYIEGFSGATIDSGQAVELATKMAHLLGIKVE